MNVSQLLKKLVVIADIEIVIALLPEMFRLADEPSRDALLERLDRIGEGAALRLAETANERALSGGFAIAGFKDGFNGLLEESRDGKSQRQTRVVLPGFNCIHRLPRYLEPASQVGLGPLALCPENSETILHRTPPRGQFVTLCGFIGISRLKPRRRLPTAAS